MYVGFRRDIIADNHQFLQEADGSHAHHEYSDSTSTDILPVPMKNKEVEII